MFNGEEKLFRRKDYSNMLELNNAIRTTAITLQVTKDYCDRIRIKGNVIEEISDLNVAISSEYLQQDDVTLACLKGNLDNKKKIVNEIARKFKSHSTMDIDLMNIIEEPDPNSIEHVRVKYGYITYKFKDYLEYAKGWLEDENDNE